MSDLHDKSLDDLIDARSRGVVTDEQLYAEIVRRFDVLTKECADLVTAHDEEEARANAAEYHPYEFCVLIKAGQNPVEFVERAAKALGISGVPADVVEEIKRLRDEAQRAADDTSNYIETRVRCDVQARAYSRVLALLVKEEA